MPWVRARLRDTTVYARANERGELVADGGAVEVRYKPNDGRMYKARLGNLVVVDPTVLPDETCGDAKPVEKKAAAGQAPSIENAIVAYADGACSGNPGPAGLGIFLIDGDDVLEISEYLGTGTNNIAELTAVLRTLERVADPSRPIVIHTDSQYSIGVLTKGWKAKANVDLVAKIKNELRARPHVRLVYVPGHAGVSGNERADQLAREAVATRATSIRPAKISRRQT